MEVDPPRKLGLAGYHQNLIYNMNRFTLFDYKIVFKNLKIWYSASMEHYHNRRRTKWKTTSIEDVINQGQPK